MDISLNFETIPKHIAIIMDGNKRWATKHNTSLLKGHRKGLERIIETIECCEKLNIKNLSVFAFSGENWKRPSEEINDLMYLFKYFFRKEFKTIKKKGIKILHSGLKDKFQKDIQNIIDTMVQETKDNTNGILNLAINYTGRQEIIYAVNKIISKVTKTKAKDFYINENNFSNYLFHPKLPEPELLIRTSGEQRVSNFLLWQLAYTELYFTDVLWPDFTDKDLIKAIEAYQQRERRFGGRL